MTHTERDYDDATDQQCGDEDPHCWHYWESSLDVLYWCFGAYE